MTKGQLLVIRPAPALTAVNQPLVFALELVGSAPAVVLATNTDAEYLEIKRDALWAVLGPLMEGR